MLIVGVDIGKSKHTACFGTRSKVISRQFDFEHSRQGFTAFEKRIRSLHFKSKSKRVLVGMEPSGLYWYALYERIKQCGFNVCLVNCLAVKNNRRTMPDGTSKTDPKDAHSIYDLLIQGKFFLPVQRDSELNAAYRMMRRHMALKKRIARLRNQLRGIIHLSFPELNTVIKDLTMPTSLRFLMAKWQPRRRSGQWTSEKFAAIYDLAKTSIGL